MAYVRPYQSQQEPSVIPSAPAAPLLDSESRNLADLGTNLGQAQKVVYEADTQRAVMAAHDQLAQAMTDITQHTNDLKETWGDDPTGFTPTVHKFVDDYGTKLVDQQANPRARAYVAETFARLGMHQVEQADNWERTQQVRYQAGQIVNQTDAYSKVVAGDPTQYDALKKTLNDAISVARLTPDMREKARDGAQKQLLAAANQSYIENDAHGAYADYSKALGLKDAPPALPNPSATLGSAAPIVETPAMDTWPGGVDPALEAEIAKAKAKNPQALPALEAERTTQQNEYAKRQANIAAGLTATGEPIKVASSGETATDTGPLPLDPMHTSTGTTTGKSYVDQLSTQQLVTLRNEAHSRMLMGQSGARAELERQMQNAETAAKAGMPVPDIQRSLFDAAYPDKPTADAKYATLGAWQAFGTDVKTIQTMPGNQIEQYLAEIKPTDSSAVDFTARMQRWTATAAAAQHIMNSRQADPVLALGSQGVFSVKPLDLSNPAALQTELENRQQNSSSAQGTFLDGPAVFTKSEAKALGTTIQGAPFAMQVQMLGALRKGLSDDATFRAALQQIHPDAPEIAAAATLANVKPGYTLAPGFATPQGAAELALRGAAILHPSKAQKETDGIGATPVMPDPKQLEQAFADRVGDAYAGHPGALKNDFQIFREIYAGAAARDGVVVGSDRAPVDKYVTEALNGATGGLYGATGGHTIIKPYGMPDDVFAARYADAYRTELARNGMNPETHAASDYPPVNADDGSYYLRAGAGYLMSTTTGRPIKIEVPTDAIVTPIAGTQQRTTTAPAEYPGRRLVKGTIGGQ